MSNGISTIANNNQAVCARCLSHGVKAKESHAGVKAETTTAAPVSIGMKRFIALPVLDSALISFCSFFKSATATKAKNPQQKVANS